MLLEWLEDRSLVLIPSAIAIAIVTGSIRWCVWVLQLSSPSCGCHIDNCFFVCYHHTSAGDTTKATDPYFPFENAVDVWVRTFAGLGIHYKGSVMTLDLCDRNGKYSNGFCHWPQVRGGPGFTVHQD